MTHSSIFSLSDGHSDSVVSLTLLDRILISGGDDGVVCLWSPGQSIHPFASISLPDPCCVVKFPVAKPHIFYSAHQCRIYSWDTRNLRTPVTIWNVNDDEINCLDILDSESRVAAADDTGSVQIIATDTGDVVRSLKKHDNICSSVKFRPNKPSQIISGGLDCRLIVSDWKGSGLGVMIFEMDELIDTNVPTDIRNVLGGGLETRLTDSECNSDESDTDDVPNTENSSIGSVLDTPEENLQSQETYIRHGLVNRQAILLQSQTSPDRQNVSSGLTAPFLNGTEPETCISSSESDTSENDVDNESISEPEARLHRQRNLHPNAVFTEGQGHVANAWSLGMPINPPMVHAVACTPSGAYLAAGLESNTIELFVGSGKRLIHMESLYGHTRGISALLCIGEEHLVSGGNDSKVFVWKLTSTSSGHQIDFGTKVDALEGNQLDRIFITDFSSTIQALDLSVC